MAVTRSTAAKARSEWIRMGSPLRARNCLGCGPAMRVPRPAAGRITKTCITGEVYNHLRWGRRRFAAIRALVRFVRSCPCARKTRKDEAPGVVGSLTFWRVCVEHFVGGAEAEGFVDAASGVRAVQGYDAKIAAMGISHADLDQRLCQAAPAVARLDEDVEQVAAVFAGRVEGVGRPIEN